MAAAYVNVFIGNNCFRTFGGNTADVRNVANWYVTAPFSEIVMEHPWMTFKQFKKLNVNWRKHYWQKPPECADRQNFNEV